MSRSESVGDGASRLHVWTGDRELKTVGTNFGSARLAFQHWHKFKEAFAPEIVETALDQSTIPVSRVLDPFGGSGTTALAAQFMGAHAITMEVNPYLADVIEAKLTTYDLELLPNDARGVLDLLKDLHLPAERIKPTLPPTFVEPGVKGRWIFSREIHDFVVALGDTIAAVESDQNRRLFRIVLGGCLVAFSNSVISGKGRRYKKNWIETQITRGHAERIYAMALEAAVDDILRLGSRPSQSFEVFRGSCLDYPGGAPAFDLCVFSPPYPNSFDYTDVYNLELWMLGYLETRHDNRELRLSTLASHVQVHRDYSEPAGDIDSLNAVINRLQGERAHLWNRHIPEMVGAYFHEMRTLIGRLRDAASPGADIWMVVGDSQYQGVAVPTASILADIAVTDGLELVRNEPIRLMNRAPQQGGSKALPESVLVVRKRP